MNNQSIFSLSKVIHKFLTWKKNWFYSKVKILGAEESKILKSKKTLAYWEHLDEYPDLHKYCEIPKYFDTQKTDIIILKFELCGSIIE